MPILTETEQQLSRVCLTIEGTVQGVGFRPFIYRLARELGLTGWVNNSAQGVTIEAEGSMESLDVFQQRILQEKPLHSSIHSLIATVLEPAGYTTFDIHSSNGGGSKTTPVLPDIATCPECLAEILDPSNRRYLYPFTNCTHCGPRYTIIEGLPYDRPNTSMKHFEMCDDCRAEYENPLDRRFHAQPTACPTCGPHLELRDKSGSLLASRHEALLAAVEAVRRGEIVAIKGLGGFHLVVDARNETAVLKLRERKHREEKPFALMYPSLNAAKADCEVSGLEEDLLCSPEAPIVLLRTKVELPAIAPGNPYLGVMLPYTPLHHLLMRELGFPVVATSGNLSDEPICTDEDEALERLGAIADVFLVHNRPIARHVDDSIMRVIAGRSSIIRRARGYAPSPIQLDRPAPTIIAVGAHLKNTVAASVGKQVFISQHIGDLETEASYNAFTEVIDSFTRLYELRPAAIACDLHPDYISTQFAKQKAAELDVPLIGVQHHYAHVLSCMAENRLKPPALGISWDGTGYGLDGTIWGGEFLVVDESSFRRAAHLRAFPLPGGDKAVKEPRRSAIGLLYKLFGDEAFSMDDLAPLRAFTKPEWGILQTMLEKQVNTPLTSSVGRLFDAVSSIIGLRQKSSFEGQAAMMLEFALNGIHTAAYYPFEIGHTSPAVFDWTLTVWEILKDVREQQPAGIVAAKFHNTLVEMAVAVARRIGEPQIVLTGGSFQNRYLTERMIHRLREEGFHPYWHRLVPPNDGGIALGQIVGALRELENRLCV